MSIKKLTAKRITVSIYIMGMLGLLMVINPLSFKANAQAKCVFEQYNYIRQPEAAGFVPLAHFETGRNWYAEARFNYEDVQTASFFAGKKFTGGKDLSYSFTPMLGYSFGRFTGITTALNNEVEWKNIYISAQSQYSFATKADASDFFFNWSELGYDISEHVFSGLAMQFTRQGSKNYFEPGAVAGVSIKNFSFPFYVFSPFSPNCYFVIGLNYEYQFKKRGSTNNKI